MQVSGENLKWLQKPTVTLWTQERHEIRRNSDIVSYTTSLFLRIAYTYHVTIARNIVKIKVSALSFSLVRSIRTNRKGELTMETPQSSIESLLETIKRDFVSEELIKFEVVKTSFLKIVIGGNKNFTFAEHYFTYQNIHGAHLIAISSDDNIVCALYHLE